MIDAEHQDGISFHKSGTLLPSDVRFGNFSMCDFVGLNSCRFHFFNDFENFFNISCKNAPYNKWPILPIDRERDLEHILHCQQRDLNLQKSETAHTKITRMYSSISVLLLRTRYSCIEPANEIRIVSKSLKAKLRSNASMKCRIADWSDNGQKSRQKDDSMSFPLQFTKNLQLLHLKMWLWVRIFLYSQSITSNQKNSLGQNYSKRQANNESLHTPGLEKRFSFLAAKIENQNFLRTWPKFPASRNIWEVSQVQTFLLNIPKFCPK